MLLLSACVTIGTQANFNALKPGMTTAEVTGRLGKPVRTTAGPDGGTVLEYSDTPLGDICYKVQLDASGRVVAARDMFDGAELVAIRPPMSQAQLAEAMCVGPEVSGPNGRGEMVWDWVIRQPGIRDGESFTAYLKNGRVVRSERLTILKDDN